MSNSAINSISSSEHQPTIIGSSGKIRQGVEDRHWQLFEARLKQQSFQQKPSTGNKENYTNTNDYRVIDRLKQIDQPQTPIEPNRRWETFCHQVTNKSNESDRVMSIFHNVWQKNWHLKSTKDVRQRRMTDPTGNDNAFVNRLSSNDNDRQVISSILHRTSSSDRVHTQKDKKNPL